MKVIKENSRVVRIVIEVKLVEKQSDEKPTRKNRKVKQWKRQIMALNDSQAMPD